MVIKVYSLALKIKGFSCSLYNKYHWLDHKCGVSRYTMASCGVSRYTTARIIIVCASCGFSWFIDML